MPSVAMTSFARGRHVASPGKLSALVVQIVLYSHAVLLEEKENETEADFEIVSINARPTVGEEPMDPVTMTRNFLHRPGGTKGEFKAEDFATAILYWQDKARKGFSHFEGSETELLSLVETAMRDPKNLTQGYKPGVILVSVDPTRFKSSTVHILPGLPAVGTLETKLSQRRPGEDWFLETRIT